MKILDLGSYSAELEYIKEKLDLLFNEYKEMKIKTNKLLLHFLSEEDIKEVKKEIDFLKTFKNKEMSIRTLQLYHSPFRKMTEEQVKLFIDELIFSKDKSMIEPVNDSLGEQDIEDRIKYLQDKIYLSICYS